MRVNLRLRAMKKDGQNNLGINAKTASDGGVTKERGTKKNKMLRRPDNGDAESEPERKQFRDKSDPKYLAVSTGSTRVLRGSSPKQQKAATLANCRNGSWQEDRVVSVDTK